MYPNDEYRPDDGYDTGSTPPAAPSNDYGTADSTGASAGYGADSQPAQNSYGGYGASDSTGASTGYGMSAGYGVSGNTGGYTSGEWHGSPYSSGSGNPPTPEKPKKAKRAKKGWTAGKIVALCLVCALVGGCASGGAFTLLSSRNQNATTSSTSTVLESDRTTTTVETTQVTAGEAMTVSEIYAAYSGSVVCIEVSTDSGTGAGTGFVITSDGYIVTCYHVIEDATDIVVTFATSGDSYSATLVGGDDDNDIAVLKIDATGLTPVVLGDSSQLQVGDTVTTIGNALGTLSNTTTTGVVSALDRAITMSDGSVINVLQTDCTVNSGNSGGPLFNEYGEVVGIVNAKYSSDGSSSTATIEGIGFAIPYADVSDMIVDLMEYGYITGKPYLGITVSTVTPLAAQQYNMTVGAYVNSVTEGSCAETAGLQEGDIIIGVDGETITTYEELVTAKNEHSAGDEMVLDVWRDGEELTITVILDEEVPDTTTDESSSDESSDSESNGYSDDDSSDSSDDFSSMSPEDFFNYFFGGGNGGNGNSNGGNGSGNSGGW